MAAPADPNLLHSGEGGGGDWRLSPGRLVWSAEAKWVSTAHEVTTWLRRSTHTRVLHNRNASSGRGSTEVRIEKKEITGEEERYWGQTEQEVEDEIEIGRGERGLRRYGQKEVTEEEILLRWDEKKELTKE